MTARDQATMAEAREQAVRHAYNQASGHYLPDPLMTECPVCSARFVPAGWLSAAEVADREAAAEQRGREKERKAQEAREQASEDWIKASLVKPTLPPPATHPVDLAARLARGDQP